MTGPSPGRRSFRGGLVPKSLWEQVEETALALFRRGTEIAARNGLILVDTKYEFGLHDGALTLADEVHTPDSSRYWYADTWEQLFAQGAGQRELDKEYLRQWLLARGWKGDGPPPAIPDDVRVQVAAQVHRGLGNNHRRGVRSPRPERRRGILAALAGSSRRSAT